ncbi:MAG: hypothetical protein ACFFCM_17540 [Promethearchaeota archaeon]
MFEISAADAKKIWLKQINNYKQPWPEWVNLKKFVEENEFELADYEYTSGLFLVTKEDKNRFMWIHKISDSKYDVEDEKGFITLQKPFPNYLLPLIDLKWEDSVMMAGGIAAEAQQGTMRTLGKEKNEPYVIESYNNQRFTDQEHLEMYINYENKENVKFPDKKLYTFQTCSSGMPMCFTDEDLNIYLYNNDSEGFEIIGSMENFVRYCLHFVLEKKNWYLTYCNKEKIKDYNLKYLNHMMD